MCGLFRVGLASLGGRYPLSGTGGGNEQGAGVGKLWPIFVGLPLIALLAVGAILLSGGGENPQASSDGRQQTRESGDNSGAARLGTPSLGSADAPVVLTEYADFQ